VRDTLRGIAVVLAIIIALSGAIGSIRWAKRQSTGAQFLASAMLLVLGIGSPIVNPPQQGIEEAREDKGTKGSESGDPPTH
jgi:ABC-type amino acid transport system permease subunit